MITHQNILIIEDDKWLAEQFQRTLELAGYKVTIANHGLDAIRCIDDNKPDAIVLDVLLTGSNGFTLMHELQSYDDTARIPIILCTNLAPDFDIKDLKPYGVKYLLDKSSMHPNDIINAVKSHL